MLERGLRSANDARESDFYYLNVTLINEIENVAGETQKSGHMIKVSNENIFELRNGFNNLTEDTVSISRDLKRNKEAFTSDRLQFRKWSEIMFCKLPFLFFGKTYENTDGKTSFRFQLLKLIKPNLTKSSN